MNIFLQRRFRKTLVRECEEHAFREFANAAFDETKVAEVEVLRAKGAKELESLKDEHDELSEQLEQGYKRETRDRVKELEKSIAAKDNDVNGCDSTIRIIRQTAQSQRQKGAQWLARAGFIKGYSMERV